MKLKHVALLALLCLPWLYSCSPDAEAWMSPVVIGGGVEAGSAAFEGDILNETFDSAGYDNAGWTETGTLDEDSTDNPPVGSATGFSGHALEIDDSWATSYAIWDSGSDRNSAYFRFRLYVKAEQVADGESIEIVRVAKDSNAALLWLDIKQTDGTLYLNCEDADGNSDSASISTGTSYEIEMRFDNSANINQCKLDGVQFYYNDAVSAADDWQRFLLGYIASDNGPSYYYDDVDIDSSGYPTD